MLIKNRIRELRFVRSDELRPNPKNWRTHPDKQKNALKGLLSEIGIADACLARELSDGSLQLIDGHLRAETIDATPIPVLVLDVDEEEADKLLATLDPLAALANSDASKLEELLSNVVTGNRSLQDLIEDTAKSAGIEQQLQEALADDDDEDDEDASEASPTMLSGVRLVQLYLDETTIDVFQEACTKLAEVYGTSNITDTVFEVVKRARALL